MAVVDFQHIPVFWLACIFSLEFFFFFFHLSPRSGLELGWDNLVILGAKFKNSSEGLRLNASLRERCLTWLGLTLTKLSQITLLSFCVAQGNLRLYPLFSMPHGTPSNIHSLHSNLQPSRGKPALDSPYIYIYLVLSIFDFCLSVLLLNYVWLFVTLWIVAHQVPLFLGISRQEYWNGLPFPPPGTLSNPGSEPMSPLSSVLQADSSSPEQTS